MSERKALGPYQVLAKLGEGGMGEVYRAHDTKLNRDVAIKVLLPAVANDPERLARFSREAQLLAALNHPNIAHIHGLEDSAAGPFLVMELVSGPTLADRIAQSAIPLDEAIPIARQIADALQAAHDQGIVHRDLKPANIKVSDDGVVKVLDFGLAKALETGTGREPGSDAHSPTITTPAMTVAGIILGTAAYMSPEQAKGRAVDKRTDVWAFGCVLFEMLTRKRAFEGEDVTDTIAAIVRGDPDWSALPPDTSPQLRLLLKRCLEKDRRNRIADISVARFLMSETVAPASTSPAPAAMPARRSRWGAMATAAAALIAGAAIALLAVWRFSPAIPPERQARFTITPPESQSLNPQGNDHDLAIAPDGSYFVYRSSTGSRPQLLIRGMNDLEARVLQGTVSARNPFISADGRWVGFFVAGELRKVAISGGAAVVVCKIGGAPRGASWGDDDSIVFATAQGNGLQRVPASGGEPKVITTPAAGQDEIHDYPHALPGGGAVLFTSHAANVVYSSSIEVVDVRTLERKKLVPGGLDASFAGSGHLIYAVADNVAAGTRFRGTLRAARFDARRLAITSESVSVSDAIDLGPNGAANYAMSRRGDLVYLPAGTVGGTFASPPRELVWVDRRNQETPLNAPRRSFAVARISPDGSRVALDVRDQTNDISIWDLARQTLTEVNRDPAGDMNPVWTPDGKRVIWTSTRNGSNPNLYWQAADGTGAPERLTTHPQNQFPTAVTPDGSHVLVFGASPGPTNLDLFRIPLQGPDRKPESIVATSGNDINAALSPDGRWLAYQSNESGEPHVFVRPFPNVNDGRSQISTTGGTRPAWRRDGRELFYLDQGGFLMSVTVQAAGASFAAGKPERILKTAYYRGSSMLGIDLRAYDVSPDGQRFLMIKEAAAEQAPPAGLPTLVVVLNWRQELIDRLPER